MKFLTDEDAKLFLIEIGNFEAAKTAKRDYRPVEEEIQSLVKKRDGLVGHLKDHRKAQDAKAQWRGNRHKMMKGIKTYHKSTEGKRFHRNLGNFLATRTFDRRKTGESLEIATDLYETMKAVTSAKTHLIIEMEYYHSVFEQAEIEQLTFDYALPMLSVIEKKIISREELSEDETAFLLDMVEEDQLTKAFNEVAGKTEEDVKALKKALSLT